MKKKKMIIEGIEIYVCDNGEIYHKSQKYKIQHYPKTGYCFVSIKRRKYLVHRLVASAFITPLQYGDRKYHVHHKNENKEDNRVENLVVMTMQEHQALHKTKYSATKRCEVCGKEYTPHKTKRKRSKTCSTKCWKILCQMKASEREKPIIQYDDNGIIKMWKSGQTIQNETGYFGSNIVKCCKGVIKTYKGYKWRYATEEESQALVDTTRDYTPANMEG